MKKIVLIVCLTVVLTLSCFNQAKKEIRDLDYFEMLQSIQIDSLRNIEAFWRNEVVRLLIYTKGDTLGYYLLKRRPPEDKIIMLNDEDHWLPIDSVRTKDSQLFSGVAISRIKYCYELMDDEKYPILRISRDLKYDIKIIFTDSIDFYYIPYTNIYGVDKYINNNNLKNIFGKWWIEND